MRPTLGRDPANHSQPTLHMKFNATLGNEVGGLGERCYVLNRVGRRLDCPVVSIRPIRRQREIHVGGGTGTLSNHIFSDSGNDAVTGGACGSPIPGGDDWSLFTGDKLPLISAEEQGDDCGLEGSSTIGPESHPSIDAHRTIDSAIPTARSATVNSENQAATLATADLRGSIAKTATSHRRNTAAQSCRFVA